MNLTEFHMEASYNALINLKKTHALGVFSDFKITASRKVKVAGILLGRIPETHPF